MIFPFHGYLFKLTGEILLQFYMEPGASRLKLCVLNFKCVVEAWKRSLQLRHTKVMASQSSSYLPVKQLVMANHKEHIRILHH